MVTILDKGVKHSCLVYSHSVSSSPVLNILSVSIHNKENSYCTFLSIASSYYCPVCYHPICYSPHCKKIDLCLASVMFKITVLSSTIQPVTVPIEKNLPLHGVSEVQHHDPVCHHPIYIDFFDYFSL